MIAFSTTLLKEAGCSLLVSTTPMVGIGHGVVDETIMPVVFFSVPEFLTLRGPMFVMFLIKRYWQLLLLKGKKGSTTNQDSLHFTI